MGLYFLALKHSPEGNHIPLWIAKESLKQEHGFSTLLCDNSDLLINLLDQLASWFHAPTVSMAIITRVLILNA